MLRMPAVKATNRLRVCLVRVALKGKARTSVSAAMASVVPMLKRTM